MERDLTYHIGRISKFPQGEWFCPTNKDGNDFDICDNLFEWGLIERRIIPIHYNHSTTGSRHEFKYKLPLVKDNPQELTTKEQRRQIRLDKAAQRYAKKVRQGKNVPRYY